MVFGHVVNTEPKDMYLSRVAAINGGCAEATPAFNVNRLCGSGLQAIVSASQSILLGDTDIAIGGGAENMSRAPLTSLSAGNVAKSIRRLRLKIRNIAATRAFWRAVAQSERDMRQLWQRANMASWLGMRARGPTRIGLRMPNFPACTAPRSELSSQGCATAQGTGGSAWARPIRRSYLSCWRSVMVVGCARGGFVG